MAFDWKEYHKIALFLKEQKGTDFSQEAAYRCAVSRAYYAAYCHTRNHARDHQKFVPTYLPDDHEKLREHFRKRDPKTARHLDDLRQWRNSCDYDDVVSSISVILDSAVPKAKHLLDKF